MPPLSHRRLLVAPLMIALLIVGALPTATAAATNDTIRSFSAISLFPEATGASASAEARLSLRRSARVSVTVRRLSGTVVRTLAKDVRLDAGSHRWLWDGRNSAGTMLRQGTYRIRVSVTNRLGTLVRSSEVMHGLPAIFPANPGAITVSIDPGHGGIYWGAFYDGAREKHFNLDIAFRLRSLLEAAGVRVVLTRTTDSVVNTAGLDVNGDGKVTKTDDLAARLDIANGARSDVHISIHNNSAGCRCVRGTETYTSMRRSWTPEGETFATLVHRRQLAALDQFRSATYWPVDRGVKSGSYYVMSPYDTDLRPRPSQMPTLLTESLYVNNDVELALLRRDEVRQALAIAFYLGMADYLNRRDYGIRYQLLDGPGGTVSPGAATPYTVRVTNRGNRPSSGWSLELRARPQVPYYDGSEELGQLIASRSIPDGLAPGQSVDLQLNATVPGSAGRWLVEADVRIPAAERDHLSWRGVPVLQVTLQTGN